MNSSTPQPAPAPLFLSPAAGGEMARRVRAFDWSATPLGPPDAWPSALRTAAGICLNSRFPMFVWWGPDLINLYNDAYIPILGQRHPAALGRPARALWAEVWDVIGPQADAVLHRGESNWHERVPLRLERNGFPEEAWFTWSHSPIPDDAGVIRGLFCVCTEETAHVRAVHRKTQLRAQLFNVLESMTDAFLAVDADWRITHLNAAAERINGVPRETLIGRVLWDVFPPYDGVGGGHIRRAMADRAPVRFETFYPPVDRWLEVEASPVADGGLSIYARDITARKRAESELRESEHHFRELADSAPAMLWITDPAGACTFLSRGWYDFTGQAPGAGAGVGWLDAFHPDDRAAALDAFVAANRDRRPVSLDVRVRRADGAYRWVIDAGRPRFDRDGAFLGFIGSVFDITDRKLAEDAVRDAKEMAESANRAKDHFLAVLSHELRTPLTPVLATASTLESDPALPPRLRDDLALIRRNVQTEARLIDDLLDLTRITRGKVTLHHELVNVHTLLRAVLQIVRGVAEDKRITLTTDLAARHHHVWADAGRLQQVFLNLLQNAVKFTEDGGAVHVHTADAAAAPAADARGKLRVDVRDTGIGIPPDLLPRVFDAFEQGPAPAARQHGGLGLGLAIAKSLLDLHDATIRAHSGGPGKGALFTVELQTVPAPAEPAPQSLASSRFDPHQTPAPPAPTRVLLVEDHADTLKIMARLLRDMGYTVATATNVRDALARAAVEPVDLLLSDIGLPDGSGHDIVRALRARAAGDATPVFRAIALSGYGMEEDLRKSREAGFDDHLVKPVNIPHLRTVLRQHTTPAP